MGRYATRLAWANALANAGLVYVGTVFPARPEILQEDAYTQTMNGQAIEESANGSACVLVVNIPSDIRTRYADVGRGAMADWNKHIVALELFFASQGGHGIPAQEDYDQVVDALVTFIRENPTMSAPESVWSTGEFQYGVRHEQSMAYTSEDGTAILINGVIRAESWESDIGTFASG